MAESITEGTLKQFSKRMRTQLYQVQKRNLDIALEMLTLLLLLPEVGDYVERDEEIATIETDKVDIYSKATLPRSQTSDPSTSRIRSMFP